MGAIVLHVIYDQCRPCDITLVQCLDLKQGFSTCGPRMNSRRFTAWYGIIEIWWTVSGKCRWLL